MTRWLVASIWVAFFLTFYISHRRVRATSGSVPERRVLRARSSEIGMALQFAAMLLAVAWPGPWRESISAPGLFAAVLSIGLVYVSLAHLGRQWRVQAVIAEDHNLVTSGPYHVVRHPVYLAFFGMLCSTMLLRGAAPVTVLALALFIAGTEIRVRAEERLLAARFQVEFARYREQTRWAYLPGLR